VRGARRANRAGRAHSPRLGQTRAQVTVEGGKASRAAAWRKLPVRATSTNSAMSRSSPTDCSIRGTLHCIGALQGVRVLP